MVVPLLAVGDIGDNRIGNMAALCHLVLGDIELNFRALPVICPEIFALSLFVVRDNGVGGIEYRLGRAVVLLEANDLCIFILLFKAQDVFDSCATEAVDTLIVIADDADILVPRREKCGEHILRVVRILILIDHYVFEAVLIVFAGFLVRLEELHHVDYQIVKVHGVRRLEELLIFLIDLAYLLQAYIRLVRRNELGGGNQLVLGAAYLGEHGLDRNHLLVISEALYALLGGALGVVGVVNSEIVRIAYLVSVAAQNLGAGRVECARPDIVAVFAESLADTLLELACGFICEGYRENLPRFRRTDAQKILRLEKARVACEIVFKQRLVALAYRAGKVRGIISLAVFDEVYDTVDEHGGFSAARSRKYQKRSFGSKDRFKLHIIHPTEVFFDYLLP